MIYCLGIMKGNDIIAEAEQLNSISFFKRGKVRNLIISSVKQFCSGIKRGEFREAVSEHQLYFRAAAMCGLEGITLFAIVNENYSQYALRMLVRRLTHRFEEVKPIRAGECKHHLEQYIKIYSDPHSIDTISKLKNNLEEVKEIMLKNIDKILERGVSIQTLLIKSGQLKETSKLFYQRTKKVRGGCCPLFY